VPCWAGSRRDIGRESHPPPPLQRKREKGTPTAYAVWVSPRALREGHQDAGCKAGGQVLRRHTRREAARALQVASTRVLLVIDNRSVGDLLRQVLTASLACNPCGVRWREREGSAPRWLAAAGG